jgi:hypothetical protein
MFVLRIVNATIEEAGETGGLSDCALVVGRSRIPVNHHSSVGLYMAAGNWVSFDLRYSYRGLRSAVSLAFELCARSSEDRASAF